MTKEPLRVGDVLHGHCGGAFGRDSYGCKRVEALGADWVMCRVISGYDRAVPSAAFCPPAELIEYRDQPWGDDEDGCCDFAPPRGRLT